MQEFHDRLNMMGDLEVDSEAVSKIDLAVQQMSLNMHAFREEETPSDI